MKTEDTACPAGAVTSQRGGVPGGFTVFLDFFMWAIF